MKKVTLIACCIAVITIGIVTYLILRPPSQTARNDFVESEAGFEEVIDIELDELTDEELRQLVKQEHAEELYEQNGRIRWSLYWRPFTPVEELVYGSAQRLPGPPKVGIQIGHWENDEVPEELEGLTRNGSGAVGGNTNELAVVTVIAERTKMLLEAEGIVVELLPTTIPIDYFADAFVSIHADGNNNSSVSGFKIAGPRQDYSGRSTPLVELLYEVYEKETGLERDENVTRRMSGYYAFNWRRYEHALHPMTPAAIFETGFITSPSDRAVILEDPDRAARGIANGIILFFSKHPI